ncbi:hypothetical protein ISF35_26175 [Burkholderia pseudomallei]|uniref:hypothetical protein n=1 Tax=Burkholderia pseudomallei TaxID=28450 RepID=UPI0010A8D597|nr:hypothetical protein [Burkholderia pseudomallei]MBF3389916.1 hypothetical protein [Burkholderia pseudomallei]MBF3426254.1 hypothetical protein [Burkholderia pseudomallei]MBF3503796.1 hypothetical protein [Burkholderia pseudomallei]MBF3689939.1 hypothetical protein [Burkholderia pseudomallei]MBF3707967.1 hypothetical protein [Burkholderia pseudomallei]
MSNAIESPFGNSRAELAQTAGARQGQSREIAEMQVTYLMAQQFPRDPKAAMDRILDAFTRLSLAEKSQYVYSRGGSEIRGPSIKAMEAIAAEWENIDVTWRVISRGVDARGIPFSEVEASATDTQTRTRKRIAFPVSHWRDTRQGGYKLTDERDIYELCANMAQRRVRACIEAVIPTDVIEAAMEQADTTLQKVDTSPEAIQNMLVAFQPFGVTKTHIEKRIQRTLDTIKPTQMVTLKRIYASLRDGMSEPADWFDMPGAGKSAHEGDAPPAGTKAETIKARMRERGERDVIPTGPVVGETSGVAAGETAAKAPGELPPGDTAPTYAEIAAALHESQTVEDVDAVADLIRAVEPAEQREELMLIYRQRRDELDPPFESNPPREQPSRSRTRGRRA